MNGTGFQDARAGGFSIRFAHLADLERIGQIEIEAASLFPPDALPPAAAAVAMPREELAACLASALLWVAEEQALGVVAGFLAARREGRALHIVEMDVLPRLGRRGVGTRLLRCACKHAAEQGCRDLTLTTFEHLPWNAPFYARHGFHVLRDFEGHPHLAAALRAERLRGLERRVAMAKRLG